MHGTVAFRSIGAAAAAGSGKTTNTLRFSLGQSTYSVGFHFAVMSETPFYCRYYVGGHRGRNGHEFMEFEITSDGKLRYANNSNYKKDFMIRKEVMLGPLVIEEIKRIIRESDVTNSDDSKWPAPDKDGRQELEVRMDREHISFTVSTCLIGLGWRPRSRC